MRGERSVIVASCLHSSGTRPGDFPPHPLDARASCVIHNFDEDTPQVLILSTWGLSISVGNRHVAFPLGALLRLAGEVDPELAPAAKVARKTKVKR
jgi:hypothetical protein